MLNKFIAFLIVNEEVKLREYEMKFFADFCLLRHWIKVDRILCELEGAELKFRSMELKTLSISLQSLI